MIRIRRIAGRIPVGRVYEIEYRPEGGTRDDGLYGATRSPEAYLEKPFGADLVRSLVAQADWEWQRGNKDWAVAFDESTGRRYEGTAPRFGLAPLGKGVGWWWLVPQVVWLSLGFGPAVLNVLLNGAYRILRRQRIQAAKQLVPISE